MEIDTAIVSDSTLREVEQTGLKADVYCVGGGYLGDVVTTAADIDPPPKNLIVLGGINDATSRTFKDEEQFEYSATKGLQKLVELSEKRIFEKITFIPPLTSPNQSDELGERIHFIEHTATCLFDDKENIGIFTLDPVKMDKDEVHPDRAGVGPILHQLNDHKVAGDLILHKDFIVSSGWYRGVQPAHAYGCHTCYNYKRAKGSTMCDDCKAEQEKEQATEASNTMENFPTMEQTVERKSGEKRNRNNTPTMLPVSKRLPANRGGRNTPGKNQWC